PPGDPAQIEKVLAQLRAAPGVAGAVPLDDAANAKLLEPWLGQGIRVQDLQLPRLIDVRLDPAAQLDRDALAKSLADLVPGARIDDNQRWLDRLYDAALAIELIAALVVLLVAAAAVMSIVFATRTGLAIHHGTVEVLHLIGARDTYIAGQFQR